MRLPLRRFQLHGLAIPLTSQLQVMITDDGGEARIGHEFLEDFAVLWSFRDQVSHGNNAVAVVQVDLLHQLRQFVVTTMNVSNYDRAATHPFLRVIAIERLLVNIRRALFLLPFYAINILSISGHQLFTQLTRPHDRIEIYEIDYLAHRFIFVRPI